MPACSSIEARELPGPWVYGLLYSTGDPTQESSMSNDRKNNMELWGRGQAGEGTVKGPSAGNGLSSSVYNPLSLPHC